ncbi:MAG: hypothetical protein V4489_00915 [Chlamydiota bacterium]
MPLYTPISLKKGLPNLGYSLTGLAAVPSKWFLSGLTYSVRHIMIMCKKDTAILSHLAHLALAILEAPPFIGGAVAWLEWKAHPDTQQIRTMKMDSVIKPAKKIRIY